MHESFFVHPQLCLVVSFVLRVLGGSVSAPGARRASFFTRAPPVTF